MKISADLLIDVVPCMRLLREEPAEVQVVALVLDVALHAIATLRLVSRSQVANLAGEFPHLFSVSFRQKIHLGQLRRGADFPLCRALVQQQM